MLVTLLFLTASAAEPDWSVFTTGEWPEASAHSTAIGTVNVASRRVGNGTCVVGEATVDATVKQLATLSRDMKSAIDWSSSDLAISEEVSRSSPSAFVLYQYFDAPGWTFSSDRYWVIAATVTESATQGSYTWNRVNPSTDTPDIAARAKTKSASVVEPPVNYGDWRFASTAAGTKLDYRTCVDFGGSLPSSVTGWLTASQVPALFADLVTEAKTR